MHWYFDVLKKYFVFDGRAHRTEFWMFMLFNIIVSFVLGIIDRAVIGSDVGVLGLIYSLGVLLPALGLWVRRMHDIGKSGWWVLLALVPCIGVIVLIVFAVMDSEAGDNQYGPYPK